MKKPKQDGGSGLTTVRALKVAQWLKEWDAVQFDKKSHRREPGKYFYVFSLSARQLRALSGVYRRTTKTGRRRSQDLGIQRAHEESRSRNIAEYIKYGYPWSDLSKAQRQEKYVDLRKPGWLPTAIVVNILTAGDQRESQKVDPKDLIVVQDLDDGFAEIQLPFSAKKTRWRPHGAVRPLEVIDGQHRLLAFDESLEEDFQLPVVAFHGLDISWQAYLFWTINIKPKRINPSLAFDLYPLLRTEEWLERFEGHKIYRETRAQELVEALWSEPTSSWFQRINMLGEAGMASVTQAAWIRALLKTYIKASEGRGITIGGLYGAPAGSDETTLTWNRAQQGALLIQLWNEIQQSVSKYNRGWAKKLRSLTYKKKPDGDPAFVGPHTLLNNDQGVTVVLNVTNDLLFRNSQKLNLKGWQLSPEISISEALEDLRGQRKLSGFLRQMASALSTFDWRSSGADGLTERERTLKLSFRGGSGYREFRRLLLKHLSSDSNLGQDAADISKAIGFKQS